MHSGCDLDLFVFTHWFPSRRVTGGVKGQRGKGPPGVIPASWYSMAAGALDEHTVYACLLDEHGVGGSSVYCVLVSTRPSHWGTLFAVEMV